MASYSVPAADPDDRTIASFSKRLSELTTRTRLPGRGWVGSPEVALWNSRNTGCRKAKTACDRKIRFLFESTREDFFPTRAQFLQFYNMRDRSRCRTFNKTANKRRRADILFVTGHNNEEGIQAALQAAANLLKTYRDIIRTPRSYARN
ncbi:hypothetical protein B0H16DRAFT_1464779 [Mycena metata]|uniref:Uncharacterized protein n=1 Tax=Mycena metata TaxID=1033252 RepID=A0AAD7IF28_9AGAR|nr:hypothetical protein B0H16DRAFT_1464779 [Mycena metata]